MIDVGHLQDRYVRALRGTQRSEAERLILDARGAGADLTTLYLGVFQPALREIGRLWQENEMSVAEEHFATAVTQTLMASLYRGMAVEQAPTGPSIVAACAPSERHEVGLRMVTDLLDLAGWETIYLGSSVPADDLVAMVRRSKPDVLALSASLLPHLTELRAVIRAVRDAPSSEHPFVVVGGRMFMDRPDLHVSLDADMAFTDAGDAVSALQERFH